MLVRQQKLQLVASQPLVPVLHQCTLYAYVFYRRCELLLLGGKIDTAGAAASAGNVGCV